MLATVDDLGLELRDANCWLRVVVRRQAFPNAQSDWDRDALDAVVKVDTGIFRGSFGTTLWAHELADLRALLQALLDQLGQHLKASFALIEHGAEFDFELLRRGATRIQVTLRTDLAGFQRLDFELEVDPSQLTSYVGQVDAILTRFSTEHDDDLRTRPRHHPGLAARHGRELQPATRRTRVGPPRE
jgi:hypothetical protein